MARPRLIFVCPVCSDFVFDLGLCNPCWKNKINSEVIEAALLRNRKRAEATSLTDLPLFMVNRYLDLEIGNALGKAYRGESMALSGESMALNYSVGLVSSHRSPDDE